MQPSFNMDDVHRISLDETLAAFGLGSIAQSERQLILHARHQLAAYARREHICNEQNFRLIIRRADHD